MSATPAGDAWFTITITLDADQDRSVADDLIEEMRAKLERVFLDAVRVAVIRGTFPEEGDRPDSILARFP